MLCLNTSVLKDCTASVFRVEMHGEGKVDIDVGRAWGGVESTLKRGLTEKMHYTQIRKIMIMMIEIRKEEREQGGIQGNREKKGVKEGGKRME